MVHVYFEDDPEGEDANKWSDYQYAKCVIEDVPADARHEDHLNHIGQIEGSRVAIVGTQLGALETTENPLEPSLCLDYCQANLGNYYKNETIFDLLQKRVHLCSAVRFAVLPNVGRLKIADSCVEYETRGNVDEDTDQANVVNDSPNRESFQHGALISKTATLFGCHLISIRSEWVWKHTLFFKRSLFVFYTR